MTYRTKALAIAAALVVATSCGDNGNESSADTVPVTAGANQGGTGPAEPGGQSGNTTSSARTAPGSLPAGPSDVDPTSVSPDQLLVNLGNDAEADRQGVIASGGSVVEEDAALGFLIAEFEVESLDALMTVRDRLRAGGIDAELALWANDPTTR